MINALLLKLGAVVFPLVALPTFLNDVRDTSWQLRVITTSRVCLVQLNTASPIGELVSSHALKKNACVAARDLYDDSMSDQSRCWQYGTATRIGCKNEGVDLPGAKS